MTTTELDHVHLVDARSERLTSDPRGRVPAGATATGMTFNANVGRSVAGSTFQKATTTVTVGQADDDDRRGRHDDHRSGDHDRRSAAD